MSNASFTVEPLVGGQFLVEGTDTFGNTGTTILQSEPWTAVQEYKAAKAAEVEFDTTVKSFFAPLIEASEKRKATVVDPWSTVVLEEGIVGEESQPGLTVELDADGVILRLLDSGDIQRLRWIANGTKLVALKRG